MQGLGETWQPRQLVDIALRLGPPVHGWLYSNTNYILLGMIIQKVTGQSPVTEISHRILVPLGLRDTSFPLTSTHIPGPYAHGYYGRRVYANIRRFLLYALSGVAAVIAIMLAGPFVGLPLPLQPAQILWIYLLTHGPPGVALGRYAAVRPDRVSFLHRDKPATATRHRRRPA